MPVPSTLNLSSADTLPHSILQVLQLCIETVDPIKIILFGSQADGTATLCSDFDFSVDVAEDNLKRWHSFLAEVEDAPLTLRRCDWILWQSAPQTLKNEIELKGKVIYG